ncbi:FHA domain-containing protein [Salinibacterium sp.]|uniref:FHA domain-containing protein n=1 Tax=Salinibacterium sp. TaxID=1915057 RepID=UPI00286CC489|nr:FHA domain-containing protein [Salinibacterium sp.]
MTFTIRPGGGGGWLAFASGARLLVTPATDSLFVDAAWAAIIAPDGFRLSLDVLASNGLAATPPFMLVEWIEGADARVILRGDAVLIVVDASGQQSLSATGVSTWVERSFPGVSSIQFTVPGATPAGLTSLPFEAGVTLVAQVALGSPMAVPGPVLLPEVDVEATVREAPDSVPFVAELSVAPPDATDDAGYDYLFGDTMYRSVSDAVVNESEVVGPDNTPPVDDTLHDGETVLTSDVAKIRGRRRPASTAAAPDPAPVQNLVLAISTTGARESLAQPILVGRSPSVSKVSGGHIPRLLTVGTPDQDISRNHVQISLEGGTVVVTDLHSRNGTMIVLPDKSPQKLRAGEPTSIILGTIIDLGSGVTLTVEDDAARVTGAHDAGADETV